jgi:hypothetical protein
MRTIIFIGIAIVTFMLFKKAWAVPASEMTIQGAKVTIRAGYLDFGVKEAETVVISTTTGQCIGILCGVTHAN